MNRDHDVVLALQTEFYNIAIHGSNIVTGGYASVGRA